MSNLSALGGLGALLLALLALFFKNKADKAAAQNILSDTKIKDAPLAAKQKELEDKIKEVEDRDDSGLTPTERADRWNK